MKTIFFRGLFLINFALILPSALSQEILFKDAEFEPAIRDYGWIKRNTLVKYNGELYTGSLLDYFDYGDGTKWSAYIDGKTVSSLSWRHLQDLVESGELTKKTDLLIYGPERGKWEKAGDLPFFEPLFENDFLPRIEALGYFTNGKLDSLISYHQNGNIATRKIFDNDYTIYQAFYHNGIVRDNNKIDFIDNNEIGKYGMTDYEEETFYSDGSPWYIGKFVDKEVGSYILTEYDRNGNVEAISEWKGPVKTPNGIEWPYTKKYYKNSQLTKYFSITNGVYEEIPINSLSPDELSLKDINVTSSKIRFDKKSYISSIKNGRLLYRNTDIVNSHSFLLFAGDLQQDGTNINICNIGIMVRTIEYNNSGCVYLESLQMMEYNGTPYVELGFSGSISRKEEHNSVKTILENGEYVRKIVRGDPSYESMTLRLVINTDTNGNPTTFNFCIINSSGSPECYNGPIAYK